MARPRSEDKRKAILEAALRIFAERGIANSPTSAISSEAGVAEGSLFTYFKTKDELMGELYLELRMEFSRYLTDFPHGEDPRTRLKYIWNKYLELGKLRPDQLKVLAQLRASGKLFKENEKPNFAFLEILLATHEAANGNELSKLPPEYLVLLMRAHAEMTIDYIAVHPESTEVCRELGFKMLWTGLMGN
jgi:AcrR family transcriptional regulator